MFRRVSDAVASAETRYGASTSQVRRIADQFFRLMASRRFLPNSPTLMNAGRRDGLLSVCFVLPVEDSIEGIFDAVKYTALIQKAGGGTGFAFDTLRPTGDLVASSGGTASGPISFWRVFAQATEAIQQGAHRRGASMGMMSVDHPDILRFIDAKRDPTAFCNFNISVKIPDAFMKVLEQSPEAAHQVVNPPPAVSTGFLSASIRRDIRSRTSCPSAMTRLAVTASATSGALLLRGPMPTGNPACASSTV